MSRILFFPSSSSRASFSIARARLFALAIFFHPLFLFSLRFKVVIFSRPPFFQPVLRFVSLLIFFFGRSCAFVFEVQGLLLLLEYFLPDLFLVHSNLSFDLIPSFHFSFISLLPKLFPPDPLSFSFHLCSSHFSLSTTFHSKNFTSYRIALWFSLYFSCHNLRIKISFRFICYFSFSVINFIL